MKNVTIESLIDFQACKLYYNFKYFTIPEGRLTTHKKTQILFKDTLISIVNFFFFKKLAWQEPSYKVLENKWEKKWVPNLTASDIVNKQTSAQKIYPTDAYYTSKATTALVEFHKWFANKPEHEVVLIDEPFTVPLNKEVSLDGKFDLVLRSKKKDGGSKFHIYIWSVNMGNKPLDYWSAVFTSLDYAFRYRHNFDPTLDVAYYLWDFTDSKPGVREFLIEVKDHALLKMWADSFSQSENYYPIRGLSAYCKSCKYDKPCANWAPAQELETPGRKTMRAN